MARSRVGIKGSNQRRIKQRDPDSDESDEEYKVTDDEDLDESDECYSLEGEESEEISADFGKPKRVSRFRNNRSSSGKKVNRVMKPRKRRKVSYTEDDDDDDDEDEDDTDFMSFDRETNPVNKHREKKRGSFSEEDNDDADFMCMDRKAIRIDKPREKKRVSYTEDDDDVGGDDDDDDEEFVFSGRNKKRRKKPQEKKRLCYTEDDDDDDDEEFVFSGRNRKQRKKPREKKRVVYTEEDDDEDVLSSRNRKQRKRHGEKKRGVYTEEDVDADEDYLDFMSFEREANQVNKPVENRASFAEVDGGGADGDGDDDDDGDEDYEEFGFPGRNRKQRTKPREKKKVIYTDDDDDDEVEAEAGDEDDADFMSLDRKVNQIKKPAAMKSDSYPEKWDDDDDDDVDCNEYDDEDHEEDEDDDNDEEFMSSGRKRNHKKRSQEKKVVYTEDDVDCDNDDDDDFMYSGRKVNQGKNTCGKSEASYTEEEEDDDNNDDDDSSFMSTNSKRNQINKRREKRIVSYKEDNQEEEDEDENDAEFKLSESDFVDEEDETPKTKIIKSHPHKKTVRGAQKKTKIPKQKNRNKTKTENKSKTTKRRKKKPGWQKAKAESESEYDSEFVNSASSDHEYTISEEEREQMREARVYCANLRAKLRNQEKHEQKKYPIRKGKEKIEETKEDIGKQVCGICLSEEQKRTMRGVLSCCCHYFCFSCIMEWSKVESRCPLCKQRFTTITKAAKSDSGFDLRTVVIPVPECDQVYEPSEEELRGYLDPYESVICTECHNGGDDALMLLCDICDSSAHTFCVGLGREVPDGNWYCDGCRPTVFGTLNSDLPSSSSPITGGFDLNELYVPETPLTQQTRVHSEPNPASVGTVATTLRDRRRLRRQIHHRFLNNNNNSNNRMSDLSGRTSGPSGSSSGIRLFGSQLGEARGSVSQNDRVFASVRDSSDFYSRQNQFSVQGQGSNLASVDVALQDQIAGFCNDPPVH